MSSIENYDGLCGIIWKFSTTTQQVRCKYEFGHGGPHSYEKNEDKLFHFISHDTTIERKEDPEVMADYSRIIDQKNKE